MGAFLICEMKIAALQYHPRFGEREANFARVKELVNNFKADILVLPELFGIGYTFISKEEAFSLSETQDGPTYHFLKEIADSIDGLVVAGYAEQDPKTDRIYNSAIAVDKTGLVANYRKVHLFNKEKLWFSPGDEGFKVFEFRGVKLGVMICFDWLFPESARTLALKGAQIIVHPVNLVLPYCQNAMITRCLENGVFAITANRIGTESRGSDSFKFTGMSQITGVKGEILAKASDFEETIISAEIIPQDALDKRLNEFNDKKADRRPECYFLN